MTDLELRKNADEGSIRAEVRQDTLIVVVKFTVCGVPMSMQYDPDNAGLYNIDMDSDYIADVLRAMRHGKEG